MVYIFIIPSTYDVCVQMKYPKHILIHMRDVNHDIICLKFLSHSLWKIYHISNDDMCGCKHAPYYFIMNVNLFHIYHINNDGLCGTEHVLCDFIWNTVKPESFFCYTEYIITCYYMCKRYFNNEWFKIQCPIQYLASWQNKLPY